MTGGDFKIAGEGANDIFIVDDKGDLFVTKSLDREQKNAYHLTAMMLDVSGNRIENPGEFVVQVTDINDNTPVFTQSYNGSIEERSRIGKYYHRFFIYLFFSIKNCQQLISG